MKGLIKGLKASRPVHRLSRIMMPYMKLESESCVNLSNMGKIILVLQALKLYTHTHRHTEIPQSLIQESLENKDIFGNKWKSGLVNKLVAISANAWQ